MYLNFLQRSVGVLLGLMLVSGIFLTDFDIAKAQSNRPEVPWLSLTGDLTRYDENWYPDGRIRIPAAGNGPRYLLVPIFIENRWHDYPGNDMYHAEPIKSFSFKLQYDSSALRAVGIQKFHPVIDQNDSRFIDMNGDFYQPLAHKFNIEWQDYKDDSYKLYLNPNTALQDRKKGRTIKIKGASTDPLPHTDLNSREWKVLLYVKFQVIPQVNKPMGAAGNTPLIISNDTIMFNKLNVRQEAPFTDYRMYPDMYPTVGDDYPDPGEFTCLGGINNRDGSNQLWGVERTLPGTIYMRISDDMPRLSFQLNRAIGSKPALVQELDDFWNMVDPITTDSTSLFDLKVGTRVIDVLNETALTRLSDLEIVSDQPWLEFRTIASPSNQNPIPRATDFGYIPWIDEGILGESPDPFNDVPDDDGNVQLEVRANPAKLVPEGDEMCGVYIGHLTFKSDYAEINPVRMRITFIYFRPPWEPNKQDQSARGIKITVRNSVGTTGDAKELIFGVGHRATDSVDALFGEYAYVFPMDGFDARWYPSPNASDELKQVIPFGFGDFSANDETPASNSRDIRSLHDTLQSIIYYCKFQTDGVNNYPIVIEWDVADFPEGASLFLRDSINGEKFNVNMRDANSLGGTKYSYAIEDPRFYSFVIEYTLPRVINYVDENGNPKIKKGWNFLSMPVRPVDTKWDVVYPHAINKPYYFSQNQFQDAIEMHVGVGYFLKYSDVVDKQFAGSFMKKIAKEIGDDVVLYPGWNTIGCLSVPVNATDVDFTEYENNEIPSRNYVRKHGVWGYVTNRGYQEISVMQAGIGYWIKVDQHGHLYLESTENRAGINEFAFEKEDVLNQSVKVTIRDNSQNESDLYISNNENIDASMFELPPLPPDQLFDVRYANGRLLTNSDDAVVKLQAVKYPVSLTIENADANYTVIDAMTGEEFGTVTAGSNASITIENSRSNTIQIIKAETDADVALNLTNYPNPVAGLSTVEFNVPADGNVDVYLYDIMGNEVAKLYNGFAKAGNHTVTLNASGLAAGRYICKLTAGSNTLVRTITVVE